MNSSNNSMTNFGRVLAVSLLLLLSPAIWAQVAAPKPTTADAQPELPKDPLGRTTLAAQSWVFSALPGKATLKSQSCT